MSHVLVTGGAGFIGSHLAQQLLGSGERVVVLDNLDPFYDVAIKQRNLRALADVGGSRFTFVPGDLRDAKACASAMAGAHTVVHLAALAGVRPSIQEPRRYWDVNLVGTQTLLDAIGKRREVRLVFGSSSSVYGGNTKVPFAEADPVNGPISPYAASKRAGELLSYTWHHLQGNPVTCLRFFTVYGPRQRPEMAIHQFARRISHGQPIQFFGDGSTRRDYTYVDDIVAGIRAAMRRERGYAIFNLGGASTTTLAELVATLEQTLAKKAILDRQPEQPGDVKITYADTTLAARELGVVSQVKLVDGIQRFCTWYLAEQRAGRLE